MVYMNNSYINTSRRTRRVVWPRQRIPHTTHKTVKRSGVYGETSTSLPYHEDQGTLKCLREKGWVGGGGAKQFAHHAMAR